MDVAKVSEISFLMVLPTIIVGTFLYLPSGLRRVRRRVAGRRRVAQPVRPPIEQLAADLRRLLQRHEHLRRSSDVTMRARRLVALEGAIGDCATEAADALGLSYPRPAAHHGLPTAELRRLLLALSGAGLVLPPAIGLLAADDRS